MAAGAAVGAIGRFYAVAGRREARTHRRRDGPLRPCRSSHRVHRLNSPALAAASALNEPQGRLRSSRICAYSAVARRRPTLPGSLQAAAAMVGPMAASAMSIAASAGAGPEDGADDLVAAPLHPRHHWLACASGRNSSMAARTAGVRCCSLRSVTAMHQRAIEAPLRAGPTTLGAHAFAATFISGLQPVATCSRPIGRAPGLLVRGPSIDACYVTRALTGKASSRHRQARAPAALPWHTQ